MRSIKINAMPITQGERVFFLGKIKASDLIRLASSDIRRMEGSDNKFMRGIQREINPSKVRLISAYLKTHDACFPNGVILNISSSYILSQDSFSMTIDDSPYAFSIIDGQHRLAGLGTMDDKYRENFEVIVSIYKDLKISEQAYLFSTINSQQTKVNPSLNYNLELESEITTPRKFVALIGKAFNELEGSPWKGKIDMVVSKLEDEFEEDEGPDTPLKLAGFIREIESLVYDKKDYYQIREHLYRHRNALDSLMSYPVDEIRHPLWKYYSGNHLEELIGMLLNFFRAVKEVLPNDWSDSKSILTKTTGYGAMMLIFKDLYSSNLREFGEYAQVMGPLSEYDGKINSANFSGSGGQSKKQLYEKFRIKLNM